MKAILTNVRQGNHLKNNCSNIQNISTITQQRILSSKIQSIVILPQERWAVKWCVTWTNPWLWNVNISLILKRHFQGNIRCWFIRKCYKAKIKSVQQGQGGGWGVLVHFDTTNKFIYDWSIHQVWNQIHQLKDPNICENGFWHQFIILIRDQ